MGLEILSDLSEILPYPIPDFPLYAGIGKLANQNQYTVGCHFHPDFEFNLVLEGVMDYFINGENVHLGTGDGIFVNSQRLHYNYSRELTPCKYLVITVSPSLLPKELPAVEQLMASKTTPECSDYVLLKRTAISRYSLFIQRYCTRYKRATPMSFLHYPMCWHYAARWFQ